jgi:hypothetical protein
VTAEEGAVSEVGDEAAACPEARDEVVAFFGAGLLSVERKSMGPEVLGNGHPMQDASLLHVSPFASDARHV